MSLTDDLASQIYSEADTFLAVAAAALSPIPGAVWNAGRRRPTRSVGCWRRKTL